MHRSVRLMLAFATILALVGLTAVPAGAVTTVQRLGYCGGDDWEPDLSAVSGGFVYVVITHYAGATACAPASGLNGNRIMIQVSSDGGSTFSAPVVVSNSPGGTNYPSQADPTVAVDPSTGAVYVSFLAYGISGGHSNVVVAKSTDHGVTFPTTANANVSDCKNCDHEKILAKGNDIYVAFSQAGNHYIALSSNGGLSYTTATVSTFDTVAFAEQGVLDAAGNAWFAWGDCQSSNCTGTPAYDYRVSETLSGTTNTTFSPVLAQSPQGPSCPFQSCGFAYFGGQDALAIDGGGTMYLAYQDGQSHTTRQSPPIILLESCSRRCLSGSNSWKSLGRVDDKTASGCAGAACYALFPRLVGGSSAGQLYATWMDDRNGSPIDHMNGWNLWYRTSTNGGASWTAAGARISIYDPSQAQSKPNGFLFPYGDYTAIVLNPNCITAQPVISWGEGINWFGGSTNPGHIEFANLC
jgi:hypothetical protein